MKKWRQKVLLTSWECLSYKKSSQTLPSCVIKERLAVLQNVFAIILLNLWKKNRTPRWKTFRRNCIQVRLRTNEDAEKKSSVWDLRNAWTSTNPRTASQAVRGTWVYRSFFFSESLYKTNRIHVAVGLFSNRSHRSSKCGRNISHTRARHFFVLATFRRHLWSITEQTHGNATWNLFVKYKHSYTQIITQGRI